MIELHRLPFLISKYELLAWALLLASVLVQSGCSTAGAQMSDANHACVSKVEETEVGQQCIGTLDIEYSFKNGPRPTAADGQEVQYQILYNPIIPQIFVHQNAPNTCYAAALTSAFLAYGIHYQQESFVRAISNECIGTGDFPLTFSQILFAATKVHLHDGGIWYIDTPDHATGRALNSASAEDQQSLYKRASLLSQSQQRSPLYSRGDVCESSYGNETSYSSAYFDIDFQYLAARNIKWAPIPMVSTGGVFDGMPDTVRRLLTIDFYHSITWTPDGLPENSQGGGIVPIRDPRMFIEEFNRSFPVLAGLKSGEFGHVVLISRISYYDPPQPEFAQTPWLLHYGRQAYVRWVEVVDPATQDGAPYRMAGDDFFRDARFIFSVYNPIK
jgi:hypothetical protein